EEAERPGQTVERVVGVYRVLKPHLLASYAEHLRQANEVYEPPTRRILVRCAEDERCHVAAGLAVLRHLTRTPAHEARASAWQARLEERRAASGGVPGRGLPAPAGVDRPPPPLPLSEHAAHRSRLAQPAVCGPVPRAPE